MSVTVLLLRVTAQQQLACYELVVVMSAQQQLACYELVSGYVFNDNNS